MHMSFQKVFYVVAALLSVVVILILAKTVLIPLAFAVLTAFILFPVVKKIESWGVNEIMSAMLAIFALLLIFGVTIYLFSTQIIHLSDNLFDFKLKVLNVFAEATYFINKNFGFLPELDKSDLVDGLKTWLNNSAGTLLSQTFSNSAIIIFGFFTSIIFTFLLLIYRRGIIRALVSFFKLEHRKGAREMFKSVQKVGQQYLFGMTIIVLILGFVNSIGLWIIGLDNPFLFGFFAALLAMIPYAGTFIGAAIPILYSFISHDSIWMPISIIIFFWLVQLIESNFLTPKIVGGNLKINALTSILSIIIGALIWGIAGMILFLPLVAMLKAVCEEYVELKPFALLIGQRNYNTVSKKDVIVKKGVEKIKSWL